EVLERPAAHLLLDAGGAEHLEGAHVEEGGARQRRDAALPFHRQRRDSVLREEHGGRQADQTASCQQHRDLVRSIRSIDPGNATLLAHGGASLFEPTEAEGPDLLSLTVLLREAFE